VWRGHITDEDAYTGRSQSAGDVWRLPEPFHSEHQISVDYTFIQEFRPDGSSWWPVRTMNWRLRAQGGDDTGLTRCEGGGRMDLGGATGWSALTREQEQALEATCTFQRYMISIHTFGVPRRPPPPVIPDVKDLDEGCEYREEDGTRRTDVWLTPEVSAVVDLDMKPDDEYAKFVPEPGRTVKLTAHTDPAYPAIFKFVIDPEHTSHFAGYAGNANVDPAFFERYGLQRLANSYTDQSPDLIFDPQLKENKHWAVVQQDELETAEESASATAEITAMDYGAIGQVRAYAKFKCGGWIPAEVHANGTVREAVSVPLDEDHNFIADALHDYWNLKPDSDDEDTPQGDGTKGDGLTAFEEYRGFLVKGDDCDKPVTDQHARTTPHHKELYLAGEDAAMQALDFFPWNSGVSTLEGCPRHLAGYDTVHDAFDAYWDTTLNVPDESRVLNFTLTRANQTKFDGQRISLGPQHGVFLMMDHLQSKIGGMLGYAIPTKKGTMGSPGLTAAVVLSQDFVWGVLMHDGDPAKQRQVIFMMMFTVSHELGHAVGIPHHSDSRSGTKLDVGILDITTGLSPFQSKGLPLDDTDGPKSDEPAIDSLLIEPGIGCKEGDPGSAYKNGVFAGCLATFIVRRGQQESGDVWCPMHYSYVDYYELPNSHAVFRRADTVTGPVDGKSSAKTREFSVHVWGGDLMRWDLTMPEAYRRSQSFCESGIGTDENHRLDYRNLAGDASRMRGCRSFLVINDHPEK